MQTSKIANLIAEYTRRKPELEAKWQSRKRNRNQVEAFALFVKCILSSRTDWDRVELVVEGLQQNGLLYQGNAIAILNSIKKIGGRVNYKDRAEWIVKDRDAFPVVFWLVDSILKGTIYINDKGLGLKDIFKKQYLQNWASAIQKTGVSQEALRAVVKTLKGAGDKQASHFLFSLGFEGYAVIDTHILDRLVEFEVIKEKPKNLTSSRYRFIEQTMKQFSLSIGIPLHFLDMIWWRG